MPKRFEIFNSNTAIKKALALLGLLFSLLFFLSPNTHLKGLALILAYPFGTVGFYALCLAGAYFSLKYLLFPSFKVRKRVYFTILLLILAIGLTCNAALGADIAAYSSLKPYSDRAWADYEGFGYFTDFSLGIGILGNFLMGLFFESGLPGLGYFFLVLVYLASALVFAFPYILLLLRHLKSQAAIKASRAEREEQAEQQVPDEEPILLSKRPESIIAPEDVDDSFESYEPSGAITNPLASFRFEPAGEFKPLKRGQTRSLGAGVEAAPKEVPPVESHLYQGQPVQYSGLQEAHFTPSRQASPANLTPAQPTPRATTSSFSPYEFNHQSKEEVVVEPEPVSPTPVYPSSPVSTSPAPALEEPPYSPNPSPAVNSVPTQSILTTPVKPVAEPIPEPEPEVQEIVSEPEPVEAAPAPTPSIPLPKIPSVEEVLAPATPVAPAEPANSQAPVVEQPVTEEKNEDLGEPAKPWPPYQLPPESLLKVYDDQSDREARMEQECLERTEIINQTYENLGAGARVVSHKIGPSVTRYDVETAHDVSVSSLNRYITDIALRLGGVSVRFSEIVPGKVTSGLEVINSTSRIVPFKEVNDGLPHTKGITIPFGEDIDGKILGADLTSFPHMLVAGTTGSGKSVFINSIIMAILMRYRPEEVKFLLIDPKTVSFSKLADIPHLLCPIVTDAGASRNALKKLCELMDKRYKIFASCQVNDIAEYNSDYCEYAGKAKMPYIIVIIDEYADLSEQCKDVSSFVLRLAQKARACGIHLIVATQRPDVKVITGTIKANLPVHVALMVANPIDSSTILGCAGAEELAPHGDMLVDCPQVLRKQLARCQGCMVDPFEMRQVANWVKQQQKVSYDPEFLHLEDEGESGDAAVSAAMPSPAELKAASDEEKYQMIKAAIMTREYCSISQIQRDFSVGFTRGGKIMKRLQEEGIVAFDSGNSNSTKGSKVLVHSLEATEQ